MADREQHIRSIQRKVSLLCFKKSPRCLLYIFAARKRSLGQSNVFTPVCHSVHSGRGVSVQGVSVQRGVSVQGGSLCPGWWSLSKGVSVICQEDSSVR